jgi:hypothetical protein
MTDAKKTRPIGITVLSILVLWLAAWNGLRLGEATVFWKTLGEYGAAPLYISASGGVWLIAGLFLVWGLWKGKTWGWVSTFAGTIGYTAWYWFDRLVLQKPHANWPFVLVANIVLLLLILVILFSHPTRRYFQRDAYERKPETPTIP